MSPKRCSSAAAINKGGEGENEEISVKCTLFDICALAVLLLAYSMVAGLAPEKPREMVHYVPEDALVYGEQSGATAVAREILASHFFTTLLERERDQEAKRSGTGPETVLLVLSARRWLAAVTTHPLTKDLDVDTLGLALLPPSVIRQRLVLKEDFLLRSWNPKCALALSNSVRRVGKGRAWGSFKENIHGLRRGWILPNIKTNKIMRVCPLPTA